MPIYIEEARNNALLNEYYDDIIVLHDEDQLDDTTLRELISRGPNDTPSDEAIDIAHYAIAQEAQEIVVLLEHRWNEDELGTFDETDALDEISAYINDHFNLNVDKAIAENTDPVLVYSILFEEEEIPGLPDPYDEPSEFAEQYADFILHITHLDPSNKADLVHLIENVRGSSYTVAVAGRIDPSLFYEEPDEVVFHNPAIVVGGLETDDVEAQDFSGTITTPRSRLVKADMLEKVYGGDATSCEVCLP